MNEETSSKFEQTRDRFIEVALKIYLGEWLRKGMGGDLSHMLNSIVPDCVEVGTRFAAALDSIKVAKAKVLDRQSIRGAWKEGGKAGENDEIIKKDLGS